MCLTCRVTRRMPCIPRWPHPPRAPRSSGKLRPMSRTLISAIVAIAASAVVYAGQQTTSQAQAPQSIWQFANHNAQVLVPVSGTWTADYEKGDGRVVQMVAIDDTGPKGSEKNDSQIVQVLTIDGTAAPKAPDADAARTLFADQSAGFVKALAAPGAFPLAVARDVKEFTVRRARGEVQTRVRRHRPDGGHRLWPAAGRQLHLCAVQHEGRERGRVEVRERCSAPCCSTARCTSNCR